MRYLTFYFLFCDEEVTINDIIILKKYVYNYYCYRYNN